ncbi:MAG TPA: hypothetical protein VMQ61_05755 [Thermoanaerobaculia bacterium]|nr:hypothetical protein [Thermoanaerobaculia bacterium]
MKKTIALAVVLLAASGVACTNKEGETEAAVFLTVDITQQPGFVDVSVPAPVQIDTITLASHLKDSTASDPQHFQDVSIDNYTVTFRRTDGGTVVPPMQSFGGGVLVPSGGTATLSNYPVMYASTLSGPPFDQLFPFNGGVDRETGKSEIDTAFDLTFYGHTVSGQRVQSQTASGILIFRYGGAAAAGARPRK